MTTITDGRAIARCRPCKQDMENIIREAFGDSYWCRQCGTVVEISYSGRPAVTVDKCILKHSPAPEVERENRP